MHHHSPSPAQLLATRTLLPGDVYCDRIPQCLTTVLGSCVAVCLWDQRLRFGGMNHFLLPNRPSNGEFSGRFGDVAIPHLVEAMLAEGSSVRNLQAKLFGGAYVLHAGDPAFAVGRRNVEFAVAALRSARIPIVASRLSGTQGMVIRQCTDCGDVWVRPTGSADRSLQPVLPVQELSCSSEDILTAMVVRNDEGLPLIVRTRSVTGAVVGRCGVCSSSPFGWRRT